MKKKETNGRFVIGPALMHPSSDGMTILWESDREAAGSVTYADKKGKGGRVTSAERGTLHRITLAGLVPGTAYDYSIIEDERATFRGSFRTLPAAGPYRLAVLGDPHAPAEGMKRLVSRIDEAGPDFIVILGDLVASSLRRENWVSFFEMGRTLFDHIPFMPLIGNHDAKRNAHAYEHYVGRLDGTPEGYYYYTAQVASDFLIFLDSRNDLLFFHHGFWLIKLLRELAKRRDIRHVFVFTHLGPASYKELRRGFIGLKPLLPLMGKAGVSAVFSGHDHHYLRGRLRWGFPFFISGGGGGKLYPVNVYNPYAWLVGKKEFWKETYQFLIVDVADDRCTVKALDEQGMVFDEVGLSPKRR
jgi:hypothetical protein